MPPNRNRKLRSSSSNMTTSGGGSSKRPGRAATLEDEEWYHGLLPREDITRMLTRQGDFLVRKTEVNGEVKHVLSVFWDQKARHVVLHRVGEPERHCIDPQAQNFASIQELIAHYRDHSEALPRTGYLILSPIPRQEWELRHEQITLGKKLGEGAFGEVYKGTLQMRDGSSMQVAVKRSHTDRQMSKEEIAEIVAESRIMQKFKNEHLVRLWGVAAETQPVMLVLELVSGGGLDSYLQKNRVSTPWKIKFCLDAAKGSEYLHAMGCIHRDLACRNCLLTGDNVVKISDFGMSSENATMQSKASAKLPIRWLAVETICSMKYSMMTDVWSFGVMMWEIMHNGEMPFPDMGVREVAAKVKEGYRMPVDDDPEVPSMCRTLMQSAWLADPSRRPPMCEMKEKLATLHAQMPV